ncbi:MAG: DUF3368 domain-containing protein [Planctomycetota bacterium]
MGKPKVVTDAGPLIYLAVLERFDLLDELFDEVWVPEVVHHEVVRPGRNMPGASETEIAVQTGRFRSAKAENMVAVDALLTELDRGEAEAIVVARESNIGRVLMDDRAARTKATSMGLSVTGTIGVLLLARRTGIPIDLQNALDRLIQHNFWIALDLYARLIGSRP